MKPFNLKEYLKNPSKRVVTREGFPATNVSTIWCQSEYPVIAELEWSCNNKKQSYAFTVDGRYITSSEDPRDLFFVPEKHEGWVTVYKQEKDGCYYVGRVFDSQEKALEAADNYNYVSTIKIEWEE